MLEVHVSSGFVVCRLFEANVLKKKKTSIQLFYFKVQSLTVSALHIILLLISLFIQLDPVLPFSIICFINRGPVQHPLNHIRLDFFYRILRVANFGFNYFRYISDIFPSNLKIHIFRHGVSL